MMENVRTPRTAVVSFNPIHIIVLGEMVGMNVKMMESVYLIGTPIIV